MILRQLSQQFSSLQEQVSILQNPAPLTSEQHAPNTTYSPIPRAISPTSLESSPIHLKDIVDSIPKYGGQRMSVFQFSRACERALELILPHQEP